MTWKEENSVGVEEIDNQHKTLMELINELFAIYSNKQFDANHVESTFKKLADYTDHHFSTEEHYFNLYNYPKKEEHIKIHGQYREKVDGMKKEYDEKKDPNILFKLSNLLNEWWTWHINNVDKEYTAYFHANGLR